MEKLKRSRPTDVQKYSIFCWVRDNVDTFDGKTYAEVARLASEEFAITVSPNVIQNAAEATGVSWENPMAKDNFIANIHKRVDELETKIDRLMKELGGIDTLD